MAKASTAKGSAGRRISRVKAGDDIGCDLCRRHSAGYSRHHLVPRAQGGRFGPTAKLCSTCHQQLHALFSEATLARELGTMDLILANPQFARYLKWARKQRGPTAFRVRRANNRH